MAASCGSFSAYLAPGCGTPDRRRRWVGCRAWCWHSAPRYQTREHLHIEKRLCKTGGLRTGDTRGIQRGGGRRYGFSPHRWKDEAGDDSRNRELYVAGTAAAEFLGRAKDYEGEVADMLRLEEDVSRSIAQEIRAQLTSDESKRFATARRIDPVAQDEFLMGTAERWKATPGGFLKAVDHFKKAIEIQPDYAAAFAGWSNALMQGGFFDRVEEARMTAQKALELDPNLSDAH